MTESTPRDEYSEFIRRIRQGDEQAAEELVRRYEAEIRLEVRGWLRLRNPALRRVFDSMDICQSVLASFFARAAVGDFDLDEPPQLIRLLVGMARNKVAEQARHHQRQRRDVRRVGDVDLQAGDDRRPSTRRRADWRRAASCSRSSASGSPRRSGRSPTCAPGVTTGPPWPPSSAARPRAGASNWPGPSSASRRSSASTASWIDRADRSPRPRPRRPTVRRDGPRRNQAER